MQEMGSGVPLQPSLPDAALRQIRAEGPDTNVEPVSDWKAVSNIDEWIRIPITRNPATIAVEGHVKGPIERDPKALLVKARFYTADGEEIGFQPPNWSYSEGEGVYQYLGKRCVGRRFTLRVTPPVLAEDMYLSFRLWKPLSGDGYFVRIASWEVVGANVTVTGKYRGTRMGTLASQATHFQIQLAEERARSTEILRKWTQECKAAEERIKRHLSYRLGRELLACQSSPLRWADLPLRLLRAYQTFQRDKLKACALQSADEIIKMYLEKGSEEVICRLQPATVDSATWAADLVRAAQALRLAGKTQAEQELTSKAIELDQSSPTLRAHFWASCRVRDLEGALLAAERLKAIWAEQELDPREAARISKILRHPISLLALARSIPSRRQRVVPHTANRLCYILHNSLPYSSGGYATRAHGLAQGLRDAGWQVLAYTRPGFPRDAVPHLAKADLALEDIIDNISYNRLLQPSRKDLWAVDYLIAAADSLTTALRKHSPAVVVAASNYYTALPALIAARRLGIPFYYEVRGFWEVTRLSRDPEYRYDIHFEIQRRMEAAVSAHADGVFTLTEAMQEELETRGVDPKTIYLLPNSCDTDRFKPSPKDQELLADLDIPSTVPVIGYIGTFVGYEGLDDLARACAILKEQGVEFRLLLVGNEDVSSSSTGGIAETITEEAKAAGYQDWLIMPGRVAHQLVPRYYSLIDIAPFPRKPLPVTEMVSPMKPLEAMAMEKAVVVSSVGALEEMVQHQKTGLVFEKGNVGALAATLAYLVENENVRNRLASSARRWVSAERTWAKVAQRLTSAFSDNYSVTDG